MIILFWNWLDSLSANQAQILGIAIGSFITLLAAFLAVKTAFRQLAMQFEHKIIYEGWKDLQEKLFKFSEAFSTFDIKILSLTYFISSQDNYLVNAGNKSKYRLNTWNELQDSYMNMRSAYIAFLQSYETHEPILLPLNKMKSVFQKENRKLIEETFSDFLRNIFPEMYGEESLPTDDKLKQTIYTYWEDISEISAFIDDFRKELQNLTIGIILKKQIPERKVSQKGHRILTRNGFEIQK